MRTYLACFTAILNLLLVFPSSGQSMHFASLSEKTDSMNYGYSFDLAVDAYKAADFSKAVNLFSAIARDETADRLVRRDAFLYLGRSFLALRDNRNAREALSNMAEFEPPRVVLDPDIEPPELLRIYYDIHKERDGSYAMEKSDYKYTLAVIDFTNQSIDDYERLEPLSTGLSAIMINQLNGTTDLKVVERERINWLLDELDLQQEEKYVDQTTAVKAGRLLGVHLVLMGSYLKFGKDMLLTARLVDVESGEIIFTEQVKGKADQMFELAESLSLGIAKQINVNISNESLGNRYKETRSLDALLSYSEGLDLLESNEYEAAYEKFLEAYEYDQSYKRAYLKAKSIEPLIVNG